MKKATLTAIYETLKTMDYDPEILSEIETELNRGAEKAQANRDLYAQVKDTIFGAMSETPATIAEIYEEVKADLPEGFTKSKVQYAITRLWADEVVKTEGKTNGYALKA